MFFKKVNDQLNKNVNEETKLINSVSIGKYLLIYIPILFVMFAIVQFIASLFFNVTFDWQSVLIQTICFALFFRVFHKIRKYMQRNWKNKHN